MIEFRRERSSTKNRIVNRMNGQSYMGVPIFQNKQKSKLELKPEYRNICVSNIFFEKSIDS